MMNSAFIVLVPFLLFACAHSAPIIDKAQERKSVPAPLSTPRVLENQKISRLKSQPNFSFSWKKRKFIVGYGKWKNNQEDSGWNQMYGWGPVVWVTEGPRTRELDLRKELPSHRVTHVFHDEESSRILIFFDYGIEGPASEYTIWISEDGGEQWFQGGSLPRPPGEFPPADLEQLFLDDKGVGEALFHLDASTYPKSGQNRGELYFRATTRDGGRSWAVEREAVFKNVLHKELERQH